MKSCLGSERALMPIDILNWDLEKKQEKVARRTKTRHNFKEPSNQSLNTDIDTVRTSKVHYSEKTRCLPLPYETKI